jgi:ubiquinone/menaquinone biosynthesis C-methylase UbiE
MNLWRSSLVAFAYSYQQNAKPYAELLATTESFISPKAGQRWLDLGCGSGRLIRSVWEKSNGDVSAIIGVDISPTALNLARSALSKVVSPMNERRLNFVIADLSTGLEGLFRPCSFHGVTAGLALSYADHWNAVQRKWDNTSYLNLLKSIYCLLKKDGSFVFSTNVPNPDFFLIAKKSWKEIFLTRRLPLGLLVSLVMLMQSRWLKNAARNGRFHYLPADQIVNILRSVGFKDIHHKLTYAGQAWVFAAVK